MQLVVRQLSECRQPGYLKISKAENAGGMYGDAAARTFTKAHKTCLNAKLHMVLAEPFFQTDGNVIFIHCFSS